MDIIEVVPSVCLSPGHLVWRNANIVLSTGRLPQICSATSSTVYHLLRRLPPSPLSSTSSAFYHRLCPLFYQFDEDEVGLGLRSITAIDCKQIFKFKSGSDAILLGAETLRGLYPVETISTVGKICAKAEKVFNQEIYFKKTVKYGVEPMTHLESIASLNVRAAPKIKASVIIVFTSSRRAARLIAKYRPTMPILSVVIPRLKTNQLRWSFTGSFEARQSLIARGLFPMLADPRHPLLRDGLPTAEGTKWVRQGKLANQAFRAESFKGMIPEIVTSIEDMLKNWAVYDESKEVDVFKEYTVLAANFISRTAFTSSYLQGKKFFQKLDELTKIVARNAETVHFRFLRFLPQDKDEKEANRIEQEIRNIILGLIKTREESNETGKLDGYGNDLFGLLLKANHEHEDDKRISVDDIIDECKTFYFAGHKL